jgi:hypothetical protein
MFVRSTTSSTNSDEGEEWTGELGGTVVTPKVKMKNWEWRARRLMQKGVKRNVRRSTYIQ